MQAGSKPLTCSCPLGHGNRTESTALGSEVNTLTDVCSVGTVIFGQLPPACNTCRYVDIVDETSNGDGNINWFHKS